MEEDSPSSFHHNAAMSDRRGTKSKIREIVRREERNMRLVCCGGWSLWWWLWDRKLGACPEQLGAAAAAYTCAPGSWWPSRKRGDPPAWGKTRETTPAWLVGGHNAKILNLKTGQLPSLEVVQGMQSAGKQSGGVLVPSTPRGIVLAIQPRCKLLASDQIERGTISLHWSYDERGERGLSVVMCDVPTSFLTRPIPPSQGGGTGGKEVRARRSSGGFISRGPSKPGHPTPFTGFRSRQKIAVVALELSTKSWWAAAGRFNPRASHRCLLCPV